MDDFSSEAPLGARIAEISADGRVSDFYVTPHWPLMYKFNGELVFDEYVYEPSEALDMTPGCLDYAIDIGPHRYRVSRMMTQQRLRWVLRLLPTEIPAPDDIRVPPAALKAFLEAKYGLFLICGPTGSGKTTTIASMIKHRAERRREHVITFEDPIEYKYPDEVPSLISQREMGTDEVDFQHALRASLRQAPDVILVGEIRDGETAEIALQASETGHVVIASLHTSTASQTIQRFLKLIPTERVESGQDSLADVFRLVMCQRLMLDANKGKRFPIHEVLLPYDGVVNMIRRGDFKKLDQELETGTKRGMNNFDHSLRMREDEGYKSSIPQPTGFSESEVQEYLESQLPISA